MRRAIRSICAVVAIPLAACVEPTNAAVSSQATGSIPRHFHLPSDYRPRHKGGIDLASGLYVRENEDLVVPGIPALVLRRTYLSGYRASKQFGIGTQHNGEEYLIGDGERFQWIALILAKGSRINFRRISSGTSLLNAQFVHDETATEWYGAQVQWTGLSWSLRMADGSTMTFKGCAAWPRNPCSILHSRDADGHTIHYRRNFFGTLLRIDDGGDRWISFEYDDKRRIMRAQASTGRSVRYAYDERGRLSSAAASDGLEYRYTYTDLDELATIEEPGTAIQNSYDGGRCVHQVNRYPDSEPLVFDFTYRVEGGRIVQTESRTSDGTFKLYTWDAARQATAIAIGKEGYDPIVFDYQRDAVTKAVTALTVTCPDFGAGKLRRTATVTAGSEERVQADLGAYCFTSAIRR